MKIGTISQQNRPHRMKVPKYLSCDEVPRQIVSSAMIRLLSEWRQSTSAVRLQTILNKDVSLALGTPLPFAKGEEGGEGLLVALRRKRINFGLPLTSVLSPLAGRGGKAEMRLVLGRKVIITASANPYKFRKCGEPR